MKAKYILLDDAFEKRFAKYKGKLTESERQRLKQRLAIFKEDVFDKRLKTHKLKGELSAYHVFSISHSDRVVFQIFPDGGVYFIEVGGHDICY